MKSGLLSNSLIVYFQLKILNSDIIFYYYICIQLYNQYNQYNQYYNNGRYFIHWFFKFEFNFQRKKPKLSQLSTKGNQLLGIDSDIKNFKNYWGKIGDIKHTKVLKSSKDQNCLLSKKEIMAAIKQIFLVPTNHSTIYYSGHGHENGDWAVETLENSFADRISIEQIISLKDDAQRKGIKKFNGLSIFMDSCYSGAWVTRASELKLRQKNIEVWASCAQNQVSVDTPQGGLYFRYMLSWDRKDGDLFKMQTPQSFSQVFDPIRPSTQSWLSSSCLIM